MEICYNNEIDPEIETDIRGKTLSLLKETDITGKTVDESESKKCNK